MSAIKIDYFTWGDVQVGDIALSDTSVYFVISKDHSMFQYHHGILLKMKTLKFYPICFNIDDELKWCKELIHV